MSEKQWAVISPPWPWKSTTSRESVLNDSRSSKRWLFNWRIKPPHEELVRRVLKEVQQPWSSDLKVQVLKDNAMRWIFSAEINLGLSKESVLIKRYPCTGVSNYLKYMVKSSKAKHEWDMLNRLNQLGILTVQPLAFGERRNRWGKLEESCIIIRKLDDCRTLDHFVESLQSDAKGRWRMRNFTWQLARFVKLIHDKGVNHGDFHAGNFMVKEDGDGNFKLFLIDLHRALIKRRLGTRARIKALSDFNNFFSGFMSRTARFRFLKFYAQGDDAISLPLFARRIESRSRKEVWFRNLRRVSRCFASNEEFECLSSGALKAYFRKEYDGPALRGMLLDPEGFLAASGARVVKDSTKVKVLTAEAEVGGESRKLFIKKYGLFGNKNIPGKVFYYAKNLFRRSRAFKAWAAAHALNLRGPFTPKAIAALEIRSLGFLRRSYLITEDAQAAAGLGNFFIANFSPPLPKDEICRKRRFIRQFARFIKDLHDHGIFHDDLKGSNILVCGPQAGPYSFFLIDLDRVSIKRGFCKAMRIRELVKINFTFMGDKSPTLTDRMRFLSEYLGGPRRFAEGRHKFWREVERKTAEKSAGSLAT